MGTLGKREGSLTLKVTVIAWYEAVPSPPFPSHSDSSKEETISHSVVAHALHREGKPGWDWGKERG